MRILRNKKKLIGIWVGPFVTDKSHYLIKIYKKHGYRKYMPFRMLKQFYEISIPITDVIDNETYIKNCQ